VVTGLLAALAGLASAPPAALAQAPIAIRGGRVVPVSGPEIPNGTVVMAGGKIAAVGGDVTIPAGATVIDASGKVVYPGLVDALTTVGLAEIRGVPATVDIAEVGDVNPHAKAWVALNPHSDLIPVDRANGITSVLAAPRGGLISGQSALIRLAGSTPRALTVKAPVALHVNYPTGRPVLAEGQPPPAVPEEKTFAARQRDKRANQERELRRLAHLLDEARAHGAALDAARAGRIAPPRADLPLEALVPAARAQIPIVMHADEAEDIRGAIRFASERRIKLVIAGGLEAWRCVEELKKAGVPVLLSVDRLPRKESDPYDTAFTNAQRLHAAGVRFAIVSDSDTKARNLPFEAAMARAFGLPAAAALRAITLSPAEILGVADRLGSLAPGKDAHVVVATGDIMDHRTSVTHVFIDGAPQSLETRHTRLYEQFRERP
jgi:imidazolonepropionase-like amidohydrolase